ncbi:hypothetical protein JCM19233_4438 [Vibrio astriarenae]|nr:hypothetical protein JCM19233_4438 [Vibrio sp. C7]
MVNEICSVIFIKCIKLKTGPSVHNAFKRWHDIFFLDITRVDFD